MLYLRSSLVKGGEAAPEKAKVEGGSSSQTGEQRGGKYVARIQTGYEKDGSPRYKYFKTLDERDKYMQSRGKSDQNGKRLKRKLKEENKELKEKRSASRGKVDPTLYVKDDKKKDDKDIEKSFSHFIWSLEE